MEASEDIIKYSLATLGVVIGWILSQVTVRIKVNREDKRKLKKTLYYLLEVRHQLSLHVTNDEQIGTLLHRIVKKYQHVESIKNLNQPYVKNVLTQFIQGMISEKPFLTQDADNLNSNFYKCIDNLSEVEPILAFRLHGKHNAPELLKEFKSRTRIWVSEITDVIKDIEELDLAFKKIGQTY